MVAYRLALQEGTRERTPLDWASTQEPGERACDAGRARVGTDRGGEGAVATYRLALEETGRAGLEEAVSAFDLAQQELTRERAPLG